MLAAYAFSMAGSGGNFLFLYQFLRMMNKRLMIRSSIVDIIDITVHVTTGYKKRMKTAETNAEWIRPLSDGVLSERYYMPINY